MPFVSERHFILATRETGYRTTSSAISELIDNSLQASARKIQIRTRNFGRLSSNGNSTEVAVLDDGCGMEPSLIPIALQFGGTQRFDDRNGLGRFGMGLPNSSVSQARRVDVYSWCKPNKIFHSYFDVDEIAIGSMADVPEATPTTLPSWISQTLTPSGTAIVWSKCDRLSGRRLETFRERLAEALGQSFRYFLWRGIQLLLDDEPVAPIDPLLCQTGGLGSCASEVGSPLVYEVATPSGQASSRILVRFSLLPVPDWSDLSVDDKRRFGISKGAGVSVVRAGREVAYGWFFMGQKRKENYDDWWRCEIRFEPELDELFGVTHSKQGIRPNGDLEAVLVPELEAIAHDLNRRVRSEFTKLKSSAPVRNAAEMATSKDRFLAPLRRGVPLATKRRQGVDYRVTTRSLSQDRFFTSAVSKGRVSLTINKNHPFYHLYMSQPTNGSPNVQFAVDCLLLAVARAEHNAKTTVQREALRTCFAAWSDNLATFLRK
jgi:hypothetical protein